MLTPESLMEERLGLHIVGQLSLSQCHLITENPCVHMASPADNIWGRKISVGPTRMVAGLGRGTDFTSAFQEANKKKSKQCEEAHHEKSKEMTMMSTAISTHRALIWRADKIWHGRLASRPTVISGETGSDPILC